MEYNRGGSKQLNKGESEWEGSEVGMFFQGLF